MKIASSAWWARRLARLAGDREALEVEVAQLIASVRLDEALSCRRFPDELQGRVRAAKWSARDAARRVGHLKRSVSCAQCGVQFLAKRTVGRPRALCSDACRRARRRKREQLRLAL